MIHYSMFVIRSSLFLSVLCVSQTLLSGAEKPQARVPASLSKPNVLLIISDDQGYGDFGFTGNKLVRTPRLDALAAQSAVFKNFVVAAACSPSRSAIFSGRDHLHAGVWGVPPRANLRRDETLMPAFFQRGGYRSLFVGKDDCSQPPGAKTWDAGWDDALTGAFGYQQHDPAIVRKAGSAQGSGWTADVWTDAGLEFIRGQKGKGQPWLLTMAYIIPHMPWECAEKYSAPFLAQGCSPQLAACYGSIAHLDECIGRLLDALRETGQEQDTIVAFVSDNGATGPEVKSISPEGFVSGPDWEKRNVAGLRGAKAGVWENGIRVPFLVRWPGRIAAGERRQFGMAEDVLPTLLDLAGLDAATTSHQPFTGVSLRPALEDAAVAFERAAAFRIAISGPGSPRAPLGIIPDAAALKYEDHHLALRGPRFKYHALPGGKSALYDLDADPGEKTDVQAAQAEVARRMAAECRQRWDAAIASGRAFRMQTPLITAGPEPSRVPGAAAHGLGGKVRVTREATGFAQEGDSATYDIEVAQAGEYLVTVQGEGADTCAPLTLELGGQTFAPKRSWKGAANFGNVPLTAGETTFRLVAGKPAAAKVTPAQVKWVVFTAQGKQAFKATKPNIVLILTDDMGYADIGGFGAEKEIATPQIDRLIAGGMKLTDAYVCAPICVPSRMGLFSGRHPARWGVYSNGTVYGSKGNLPGFDHFQPEKLIPRYLKEAGYRTALIGKWHLSGNKSDDSEISNLPEPLRPESKGFDEVLTHAGGMTYFWPGTRLYETGGQLTRSPAYLTDHFGDRSVDFIQRHKDAPFFLYLGFNAVHAPLQALAADVQAPGYDEKRYRNGVGEDNREPVMDRAVYAGMLRAVDRNIGKVLDALKTNGLEDNTLVIFTNDNGGPSPEAEVHSYNQASNEPYRGYKYHLTEGGVRVPFILRWPGKIPAGGTFSGLSSTLDLLPTMLAASGQPAPADILLDGVNLLPYLTGEKTGDPHETLFWQVNMGTKQYPHQFALRSGPWKLHQAVIGGQPRPQPGAWQLYDLRTDPGEAKDLAAEHPEQVRKLAAIWQTWRRSMKDVEVRPKAK